MIQSLQTVKVDILDLEHVLHLGQEEYGSAQTQRGRQTTFDKAPLQKLGVSIVNFFITLLCVWIYKYFSFLHYPFFPFFSILSFSSFFFSNLFCNIFWLTSPFCCFSVQVTYYMQMLPHCFFNPLSLPLVLLWHIPFNRYKSKAKTDI